MSNANVTMTNIMNGTETAYMNQSQELTRFALAFVALITAGLMGSPMLHTISYDATHVRMIPLINPEPISQPQLTPDVAGTLTAVKHGKKKPRSLTSSSSPTKSLGAKTSSSPRTLIYLPPRSPDAVPEPQMVAKTESEIVRGTYQHREDVL